MNAASDAVGHRTATTATEPDFDLPGKFPTARLPGAAGTSTPATESEVARKVVPARMSSSGGRAELGGCFPSRGPEDHAGGDPGSEECGPRAPLSPPQVKVIRSPNRHKTISSRVVGGVLEIRIPAWTSPGAEARIVKRTVANFERRRRCWAIDLNARARELAARYDLPQPSAVRWSSRQRRQWGSCSTATREIRISDRLAAVPPWVLDQVLVHEMAHLAEANHSPEFHALVERYPLSQRALGYLDALGTLSGDAPERVGPVAGQETDPPAECPGPAAGD